MIGGIILGIWIGNYPALVKINEKLLNLAIYGLLLLLGIGVGSNEKIISNIYSLGFQALTITLGTITGSVFFCWLIYKTFFHLK